MSDSKKYEAKGSQLMAFPLFVMLPSGKMDYKTGQPEMTGIIQGGMELRDWFAGQFMTGAAYWMYSSDRGQEDRAIEARKEYSFREETKTVLYAKDAYAFADAMLTARGGAPMTSDKG